MNFHTARLLGSYRRRFGIAAGLIAVALYAAIVLASGTTADIVLGQPNPTSTAAGYGGASGMHEPYGMAIDTSVTPNRVYVVDTYNSRVLGWNDVATLTNGEAANLVIGQLDFTSHAANTGGETAATLADPLGAAVDAAGNLYVADTSNSRVLEYAKPFAACAGKFPCVGGAANLIFGQCGSFTSVYGCGEGVVSANTLYLPEGVAVDGLGNLYVADSGDGRVLEYTAPLTPNTAANEVFGQGGSFTGSGCNSGGLGVTATTLCDSSGLAVDGSGNLYVADTANERVLEYSTPLTNTTANQVFGQGGSFTSSASNYDGVTANSLYYPFGVAVDGSGHLYVADDLNDRVLEYNTPLTNTVADEVFGQGGDFTSATCNYFGIGATAATLCSPTGVAVDGSGHLYVADQGDNRVLVFTSPLVATSPTATATPSATATSTRSPTPTATATVTATPTATSTNGGGGTPTPTVTPTGGIPTATPTPVPVTLKIAPKKLKFQKTVVGTPSKPKTVKVSNPKGSRKHPGIAVQIELISDPGVFTETNTCPAWPTESLAAGKSCTIAVTFTPSAATTQTGTLTITDNAEHSPQAVGLSGTGKSPNQK